MFFFKKRKSITITSIARKILSVEKVGENSELSEVVTS